MNLAAGHIAMRYGIKGDVNAITTACTTGARSMIDAARMIRENEASVVLAGGSESCIDPLAFVGFERCRALTTSFNDYPPAASRPFDKRRDGFVIGEGAAIIVLESLDHARSRGAKIYAELSGWRNTNDAYHLTAPLPDGEEAFEGMRVAVERAGLKPRDIDYINAHATSTPQGDAAEHRAIRRLMLGEGGKSRPEDVNVSSTKGAIGHLLGAAGAIEAIFSVLSIRDGVIPPTLNLEEVDGPGFDLNYVPKIRQQRPVNAVLTNSFGFGGTNSSLCFIKFRG